MGWVGMCGGVSGWGRRGVREKSIGARVEGAGERGSGLLRKNEGV